MPVEFKDKLLAHIDKYGFSSDMGAVKLFLDKSWDCYLGYSVFYRNIVKSGTIDIGCG